MTFILPGVFAYQIGVGTHLMMFLEVEYFPFRARSKAHQCSDCDDLSVREAGRSDRPSLSPLEIFSAPPGGTKRVVDKAE